MIPSSLYIKVYIWSYHQKYQIFKNTLSVYFSKYLILDQNGYNLFCDKTLSYASNCFVGWYIPLQCDGKETNNHPFIKKNIKYAICLKTHTLLNACFGHGCETSHLASDTPPPPPYETDKLCFMSYSTERAIIFKVSRFFESIASKLPLFVAEKL